MGHVNNAAYLDILDEVVTAATGRGLAGPARMRLEYLRPALPGMTIEATAWRTPAGTGCRLREPGGSADLLRAIVT
jgi:acyl-ACP thioesterase